MLGSDKNPGFQCLRIYPKNRIKYLYDIQHNSINLYATKLSTMSEIPFISWQRISSVAVLLLLPFAGVSGTKLFVPSISDEINSIFILDSDTTSPSIVLLNATYNKIPGEGDDRLDHLEYTHYPICQVRPMDLAAMITNIDTIPFTGVYLEAHIVHQGQYDETFYSEEVVLDPEDTTTLIIPDFHPPTEEGLYEIQYTIHWDQEDNELLPTATRTFGINEEIAFIYTGNSTGIYPDVFSRDNGEIIASTDDMGNGSTFKAGLVYSFTENSAICCLGVAFAPGSTQGAALKIELRDPSDMAFLAETEPTFPTTNPFGNETFHWIPFDYSDNNFLYPIWSGAKILALVNVIDPEEYTVKVGISSHDAVDSSAYIFGEFGDLNCMNGCPTNDLYMIRIGLSSEFCTTRIAEIAENVTDFHCAPNPANGPFSVRYTLTEQADVQFFLFDNMGRIVHQQNPGEQVIGEHVFYSDTQSLSDGFYTASLMINGKVASKQLVIGSGKR